MSWPAVGDFSDLSLLFIGAASTAVASMAMASVSRRLIFKSGNQDADIHSKLADLVHGSLLAFSVFTLALVLSDVRSNLGKTLDATLREASTITRLDAELADLGTSSSTSARSALRKYVDTLTGWDWPALGQAKPSLSIEGDHALKALRIELRSTSATSTGSAETLNSLLSQLEDERLGRLESATKSVPNVFWWIIGVFLFGAMAMNGRYPLDRMNMGLIALHMSAIGLVLALILIMDQPFRGETSVPSDPIANALSGHPLSE
ncbi:MAG: hypothetical protein U1E46_17070 [Hyphomicrobiales bacterium]